MLPDGSEYEIVLKKSQSSCKPERRGNGVTQEVAWRVEFCSAGSSLARKQVEVTLPAQRSLYVWHHLFTNQNCRRQSWYMEKHSPQLRGSWVETGQNYRGKKKMGEEGRGVCCIQMNSPGGGGANDPDSLSRTTWRWRETLRREEWRPEVSELLKFSWKIFCICKILKLNTYRQSNSIMNNYYLFIEKPYQYRVSWKKLQKIDLEKWRWFPDSKFTKFYFSSMTYNYDSLIIYNYTYVNCFTCQSVMWIQSSSLHFFCSVLVCVKVTL